MSQENITPFLRNTDSYSINKNRLAVEAAYVKKHLGEMLPKCLAEVCIARPLDPIDYIANWIYKYREVELHNQKLKQDAAKLARARLEREQELELLAQDNFEPSVQETSTKTDSNDYEEEIDKTIPILDNSDIIIPPNNHPRLSTTRTSDTPSIVLSEVPRQGQNEFRVKFQDPIDIDTNRLNSDQDHLIADVSGFTRREEDDENLDG